MNASDLFMFPFSAMGSDCTLYLHAEPAIAQTASDSAISEVLRIESTFSRYSQESYLARLNRVAANGGSIELDPETSALLDYAMMCYQRSDGLFDISSGLLRKAWNFSSHQLPEQKQIDELLPYIGLDKISWASPVLTFNVAGMEIDFGGIGKEYAADRVADVCNAMGITSGLVDLGGDIRVIGPQPDGEPWTIHIRHPRNTDTALKTIELGKGAIASSGDYERYMEIDGKRYCHILNPKTGWPVQELNSVSIVADQCLAAGSIATMAMLKGKEAIPWLHNLGVRHLWMTESGAQGGNL